MSDTDSTQASWRRRIVVLSAITIFHGIVAAVFEGWRWALGFGWGGREPTLMENTIGLLAYVLNLPLCPGGPCIFTSFGRGMLNSLIWAVAIYAIWLLAKEVHRKRRAARAEPDR